jgi:4-amino-4-deoxy-L-arabinose transferase-like glycosyltransferase
MFRGALLLLLCVLTLLVGLGRTAIVDSDEAFYAGAGREMVAGGDWITPHFNFEERLNKPILYYWLVAGTYKAMGVTEFAARMWAAISGVGLVLVAYAVGRRWVSPSVGLIAGAIVATSVGVVVLIRQALPDMPLALFISLTIWSAIEALSRPSHSERRRWLMLAAVSMGLGMITKGPIAVALPAMSLTPWILWERFPHRDRQAREPFPLGPADLLLAAAVFVLVAAPWYVAVTRVHGFDFLHRFFIGENLDRFASDRFNDRREPWFYLQVMAGGLLPWTVYGLLWIQPAREVLRRRRDVSPATARLLAWVVGPLLLLSASIGSQPRYVLPCIVPVTVLLARAIWQRVTDRPPSARDPLFTTATVLAGATLLVFGLLILRARPLLVGVNPEWSPIGAFVMIAAGLIVGAAAFFAPRRAVAGIVAAGAAATTMAFSATVLRANRPEPVEVMAAAIRAQEPADAVCACGAFARNLTFYAHTPVYVGEYEDDLRTFLLRSGTVLAVADSGRLEAVETTLQRKFPRIAEVAYLNPALWQKPGAALLDPNPNKYLQRVILVSNR